MIDSASNLSFDSKFGDQRICVGLIKCQNQLYRLGDYTGKWTVRSRLPTTSLLTRDDFRLARYSGVANCQRELRFLLSAGRRSAHFKMASSVGQRDWPHDVRRYSTFGGTWA